MDPLFVTATWPVEGPCQLEPLNNGVNNLSFRVTGPGGEYILRVYRRNKGLDKIRYEQAVISQLGAAGLSFAVPVSVPSRSGEVLVPVEGAGGPTYATLMPVIPGAHPDRQSLAHARAMGEAVGELTGALSRVRVEPRPASVKTYADLGDIHPTVPDLVAALPKLPIDDEKRVRMAESLERLTAQLPAAYAAVPLQQIHGDIVTVNMLVADDRVTGVLDFEITCVDLRNLDLASGLCGWARDLAAPGWEFIEAFGQGYGRHQPLTDAEVKFLPAAIMLRRAAIYANMAGLYLDGNVPVETLHFGVDAYLQTEDWLAAYGAELQRRARGWGR